MGYEITSNGIVVIDFLAEHEYRTGQSLSESYIARAWPDCQNRLYYHAPTRERLFAILRGVAEAAELQGFLPILHLESHGSEFGITTDRAGSEFVSWADLRPFLQQINQCSRMNLLVVMSACKGAYLMSATDVTQRAVAWAIIGPTKDLGAESLLADYGRFYSHFFKTLQFGEAFELLNPPGQEGDGLYQVASAEYFFHIIFGRYMAELGQKRIIRLRTARMISENPPPAGFNRKARRALPSQLRNQMRDHQSHFEKFKKIYFMEDIYPGLASRFEVSFEKAKRYAEESDSLRTGMAAK